MNRHQLGEFEELVMLTVGILYREAYGVAISDEIEQRTKRSVSIGALQSGDSKSDQGVEDGVKPSYFIRDMPPDTLTRLL